MWTFPSTLSGKPTNRIGGREGIRKLLEEFIHCSHWLEMCLTSELSSTTTPAREPRALETFWQLATSYMYVHASVVHASGSWQMQANPHVAGPWLSPGKPTRRAVTTIGSNDLVVGEVHMLGPSCQRYNWHTGRCDSIAFGSSPRRGKTLISNPRCLAEVSTRGKDFRR